jgi:hypothetical protein
LGMCLATVADSHSIDPPEWLRNCHVQKAER